MLWFACPLRLRSHTGSSTVLLYCACVFCATRYLSLLFCSLSSHYISISLKLQDTDTSLCPLLFFHVAWCWIFPDPVARCCGTCQSGIPGFSKLCLNLLPHPSIGLDFHFNTWPGRWPPSLLPDWSTIYLIMNSDVKEPLLSSYHWLGVFFNSWTQEIQYLILHLHQGFVATWQYLKDTKGGKIGHHIWILITDTEFNIPVLL